MAGQKGRSGGSRPGSGPKKGTKYKKQPRKVKKVTLELTGNLLEATEAADFMAEKFGYTVDQFLLAIIYNDTEFLGIEDGIRLDIRERVAQKWQQYIQTNKTISEDGLTKPQKRAINLPPINGQDPALEIVQGGKKKG